MVARLQASLLAVAVAIVAAVMFAPPASGASYTVGNPSGSWDLQTDLDTWVSSIDFRTGDQLVFKYDAAAHDVVEVTRNGYRSCSAASTFSVAAALRSGSDTVELNATGTRYFICDVQGHCDAGMKLEVKVSDAQCTTSVSPPAPPSAPGAPGSLGGIRICSGGPPTVITTPAVVSYGNGAAPGSAASLSSLLLVTMVSLLLVGLIIV